jgi:hypothetical protein
VKAAIISAAAAIFVAALTSFLTKWKEREAGWRSKKLAYYEEFFGAVSGVVGVAPLAAKIRFANAVNNLHLVASQNVVDSLHNLCDEIDQSKQNTLPGHHDIIWSRLVWHIRADLGDAPSKPLSEFKARLSAPGDG